MEHYGTADWPIWPEDKNRAASSICLSDVPKSVWAGLPVYIMKGRGRGSLARILGTGSGWVQIRHAPDDGSDPGQREDCMETSKRSNELNIAKGFEELISDAIKAQEAAMAAAAATIFGVSAGGNPEDNASQSSPTEDESSQLSGEMEGQQEIVVGDTVRVVEGTFAGKTGKVNHINNRGTYTLAIRHVSTSVMKRKSDLELVSKTGRNQTDSPMQQSTEGKETRRNILVNKRVEVIATGQVGTVIRSLPQAQYVVALDEDGSIEITKRKDELRILPAEDVASQNDEETDSVNGGGAVGAEGNAANGDTAAAGDKDDPTLTRLRASTRSSAGSPKVVTRGNTTARRGGGLRKETSNQNQAVGAADDGNELHGKEKPERAAAPARKRQSRNTTQRRFGGAGAGARDASNKRQKEVSAEVYSQTRLEAARRQRQELIVGFLSRSKEKLERTMGMQSRPNLQEWLEKIQGCEDEDLDDEEDEYTPLFYDPVFCPTCRLEKESGEDKFCWNAACWASPVYNPVAKPLGESAIPATGRDRFSALAQSPRKPGFIDYTNLKVLGSIGNKNGIADVDMPAQLVPYAASLAEGGTEFTFDQPSEPTRNGTEFTHSSRFTAGKKRAEQEMIASPLVTYAIRAPSRWLGAQESIMPAQRFQGGFFGVGWKEGLVFDEPMLPNGEQQDRDEPSLDFRWHRNMVV